MFLDGSEMTSRADWRCRREELSQLVQAIEYGPYPQKPDNVTGELNGGTLTVTVEAGGKSVSFDAAVTRPSGSGPFPAFIVISTITPCVTAADVNARGIAFITYDPLDISVDGDSYEGEFYTLYDTSPHTGNLMAWAWGGHRIMDALEVTPSAGIDPTRVAAVGCRRYGKAALVAGAFDDRVALTASCGGGSGGINSWRAAEDANVPEVNERETIHNIGGAPAWFTEGFITEWEDNVYRLPFDAHEVIALVAPRAKQGSRRETDDIAQTAAMEVMRSLDSYSGIGSIETWVGRITFRVAMRTIKKEKLTNRVLSPLSEEIIPNSENLERSLSRRQLFERLLTQMEQIPAKRRIPLLLHWPTATRSVRSRS